MVVGRATVGAMTAAGRRGGSGGEGRRFQIRRPRPWAAALGQVMVGRMAAATAVPHPDLAAAARIRWRWPSLARIRADPSAEAGGGDGWRAGAPVGGSCGQQRVTTMIRGDGGGRWWVLAAGG